MNNSSKDCLRSDWVIVSMYILKINEVLEEPYEGAGTQQCSLKLFSLKKDEQRLFFSFEGTGKEGRRIIEI